MISGPRLILTLLMLALPALSGCTTPKAGPGPAAPLPTREAVLENQHRAVDGLDRLWARSTVRVEGTDAQGNSLNDQGEGALQVIPPNRLALTLGKINNRTRLYLGSNDELYWSFDMLDDTDRSATFGRHAELTPAKTAAMGLPVHPLDLVELLAITPLPESIEVVGYDTQGHVIVQHPSRGGTRRVTYETQEWKPVRVELLDEQQEMLAASDLLGHTRVAIEGDATRSPWAADRIEIRARGFDGMVRIALFGHKNKAFHEAVFDFEVLADRVYKINRFYDLDQPVQADSPIELGADQEPGSDP